MREVHLKHIDFRWVWAKVLPQVYDDTLSYYEQLCKLGAALDELATQCEEHFTEIYALIDLINAEIERLKQGESTVERTVEQLVIDSGVAREQLDALKGGTTGQALVKKSGSDYDFEWDDVSGVPSYSSGEEGKILSVQIVGGVPTLVWEVPPTGIPSYYVTDDGKVLRVKVVNNVPTLEWADGIPNYNSGDANKMLGINASGTGLEWKIISNELPPYVVGDAEKSLCVNANGDGVEWAMREKPLPPYSLDESYWVLSVNSTGTGLFWQNNEVLGTKSFEGHGLPTDAIKAKTGDLYRDVDTDDLYWCVRYIDPDNFDSLEFLTAEFNASISNEVVLPTAESQVTYNVNFSCAALDDCDQLQLINHVDATQDCDVWYHKIGAVGLTTAYSWGFHRGWVSNDYKTVTFSGGTDVDNADLIRWVVSNAVLSGFGSTWEKLTPEMTIPSEIDKTLTVKSTINTGDIAQKDIAVTANVGTSINLSSYPQGSVVIIYVVDQTRSSVAMYLWIRGSNQNNTVLITIDESQVQNIGLSVTKSSATSLYVNATNSFTLRYAVCPIFKL